MPTKAIYNDRMISSGQYTLSEWIELKAEYERKRKEVFTCPARDDDGTICGLPLIPKRREDTGTQFFSHFPGSRQCYQDPDRLHEDIEFEIYNELIRIGADVKREPAVPFKGTYRYPDILFGWEDKLYSVEVQLSPQSWSTYIARTEQYAACGIHHTVWIALDPPSGTPECDIRRFHKADGYSIRYRDALSDLLLEQKESDTDRLFINATDGKSMLNLNTFLRGIMKHGDRYRELRFAEIDRKNRQAEYYRLADMLRNEEDHREYLIKKKKEEVESTKRSIRDIFNVIADTTYLYDLHNYNFTKEQEDLMYKDEFELKHFLDEGMWYPEWSRRNHDEDPPKSKYFKQSIYDKYEERFNCDGNQFGWFSPEVIQNDKKQCMMYFLSEFNGMPCGSIMEFMSGLNKEESMVVKDLFLEAFNNKYIVANGEEWKSYPELFRNKGD